MMEENKDTVKDVDFWATNSEEGGWNISSTDEGSQKMAPVLRQVYDQMAEPKWVIALGAGSSTGGLFNNSALVQGVDHIVPVDIYVPGCPPGPQSLMHGILTLHQKIMDREINR